MSQSLSDDEFKYTLIEKHTYSLVKSIEKIHHFILGKHTQVKLTLPAIIFFLSQTQILGNITHWLSKIQEHDFMITTSNTIKGRDLASNLAQHPEPDVSSEHENLDLAEHPWYQGIIYYCQFQNVLIILNSMNAIGFILKLPNI